ncbi:uncharacterized protein K02A2.6-like [Anneissia japonica]|uniref:uncharacterized protein K02A2.6-like n=1 Tax=Anneissia japonica TaxID=1529436 RepID=UPI0014256674|nr:uncharacterized protein K02A2.6-like [Anneissia japonica]
MIIPAKLRKQMIAKLHVSHQGIEKTKRLARDIMFWPGMNAQIADTVSRCEICLTHRNRNAKKTIGHDIPTRPWQKVGMDLFELYAKDYLLIVDYYSGYFEINQLTSTKSNSVIKFCKQQFARHGIPSEVVSDNGPQFSSTEFKAFSKSYEFEHILVSPNYPQSNGRAERQYKQQS